MQQSLDQHKNIMAALYTAAISILLCLILFFLHITLPQIPIPVQQELLEIRLGTEDATEISNNPMAPAAPTASSQAAVSANTPEEEVIAPKTSTAEDVPVRTTTLPPPINKKKITPTPVIKPPTAKALLHSNQSAATSNNDNADSYNKVPTYGNGTDKTTMSSKGSPNGNPNSQSEQGNAGLGNGFVHITQGLQGRHFVKYPALEDDFNEAAKVAVNITVDASGHVVQANINPRGTTTTNSLIKTIALKKAKELKLNTGGSNGETQSGIIVFNFRLRG